MLFIEKPDSFVADRIAAGCFIMVENKFLILKRAESQSQSGTWGLPAGGINSDEEIDEGMVRELYEETGLKFDKNELKHVQKFYVKIYQNFEFDIYMVKLNIMPEIKIDKNEHTDFKWVTRDEALKLSLILGFKESMDYFFDEFQNK
ncbi:NUDIX hydrolase [archaeon]|nr:NUDIX hydrolase [archaeon]MBT7392480.1 NUDIX hydrolase [archaeon]